MHFKSRNFQQKQKYEIVDTVIKSNFMIGGKITTVVVNNKKTKTFFSRENLKLFKFYEISIFVVRVIFRCYLFQNYRETKSNKKWTNTG